MDTLTTEVNVVFRVQTVSTYQLMVTCGQQDPSKEILPEDCYAVRLQGCWIRFGWQPNTFYLVKGIFYGGGGWTIFDSNHVEAVPEEDVCGERRPLLKHRLPF